MDEPDPAPPLDHRDPQPRTVRASLRCPTIRVAVAMTAVFVVGVPAVWLFVRDPTSDAMALLVAVVVVAAVELFWWFVLWGRPSEGNRISLFTPEGYSQVDAAVEPGDDARKLRGEVRNLLEPVQRAGGTAGAPGLDPAGLPARLAASVACLVDHLDGCEVCRSDGTSFCDDYSTLIEMVRYDRRLLVG